MKRIPLIFVILLVSPLFANTLSEGCTITAENTVLLSNETDETFCRDFSKFLNHLSLEWVVVRSEIPEQIKDKNIIILGGPDAELVGDTVSRLMREEDKDYLSTEGNYLFRETKNPWTENRVIYLCAGLDRVLTKRAAEEGITEIIMDADDPEAWIQYTFPTTSPTELQAEMARYRFVPENEELSKDELTVQLDVEPPEFISLKEAAADIDYLFNLLSHGYSGYGYFRRKGNFDLAQKEIIEELEAQSAWSPQELFYIIRDHLNFIHDCHFRVGYSSESVYCTHKDFWYNIFIEIWKTEGNCYFSDGDTIWKILSINEKSPSLFTYPSLNIQGEPVYILGILSQSPPEPLALLATDGTTRKVFEIELHRSDFESEDIFAEYVLEGIPVITIPSFADHHFVELEKSLEAAKKYRGEPFIILDIRGNGGGSSAWGETWVEKFTGRAPENYFVTAVFRSKTTWMGCYNLYEPYSDLYPDADPYRIAAEESEAKANSFEETSRQPYWVYSLTSGFHMYLAFPDLQMIPNPTVVVVLTDGEVCSAGETFIGNLFQVENVIFVGENSAGCTTFWSKGLFRLPYSLLPVYLPATLNLAPDLEIHEEEGLFPDLWVPADQSLDAVVKALKKKTIVSAPSPQHFLERGLERKGRGELREAFQDFIAAYSWLGADLEPMSILCKEGGADFTFQDLKKEIVFLCLHFIENGDEALKEGDYESALENFALINKCWRAFYTLSAFYVDTEEYELYTGVGSIYTPSVVEEKIRISVEKIKGEAEILEDQGDLRESEEKYAFIITKLTEADWNNEDIEECRLEMARVEALITQRMQIAVLVVIGLVIVSLIVVRHKLKK